MELRTRCRLIPALFAFTFCSVPVLAQETPEPPPSADSPGSRGADQDPAAPRPRRPDAPPQFPPGQDRQFAQMGQPSMMFNPMIQQSPELAKKMRAIMGLRAMWQLRLNAKDIAAILPPLKELAQAEKNLQARSEQILEDEHKALLSADPNGDPPEGSGDLMQRENYLFEMKSDEIWRTVDKSVGREKILGLRRLVGLGGQMYLRKDYERGFGNPYPAVEPGATQPPRPAYADPTRPAQNRPDNPARDVRPDVAPRAGQPGGQFAPQPNNPLGGVPLINRLFGNRDAPQFMPQVRLSLTELVSLLTERQTAMRK